MTAGQTWDYSSVRSRKTPERSCSALSDPPGGVPGSDQGLFNKRTIKWRKQAVTHANAPKDVAQTTPTHLHPPHPRWIKQSAFLVEAALLRATLTFCGSAKSSGRKSSGASRTISCLRMHHSFLAATDALISRLHTRTRRGPKLGLLEERRPGGGVRATGRQINYELV